MQFLNDITEFIFLEDRPEKADAIVILGNTWPEPSLRAAMLYREGFAPLIIPSGKYSKVIGHFPGPGSMQDRFTGTYETEADFMKAVLVSEGVPEEAVICDREATFTLENAENIRRILDERGQAYDSLIICCQALHARRSKMYFEYVYRDRDIRLLVCPAVTQGIDRDNWTRSNHGRDQVLGELKRCGEQFGWMMVTKETN